MLRVIGREEGPKKHRQETETREKDLRELETEKNEINNEDMLKSSQTNI